MQRFSDLLIWQRAHALAVRLYQATSRFPEAERFGMQSQIRRASVSVVANIAEGTRRTSREFGRFLSYAAGSLSELEAELFIARDVGYLDRALVTELTSEIDEIGAMLHAFRNRVLGR